MRSTFLLFLYLIIIGVSCKNPTVASTETEQSGKAPFNIEKDLLLLHYDCKTDVDDLHSIAAFASLISTPEFKNIKYHAVAGTYGIQEGLYVPADTLFRLAFGIHWSDAHGDKQTAVEEVRALVNNTIDRDGHIWIAEAGQSDFSAELIKMFEATHPTEQIFSVVQHSNWNEKVTTSSGLGYMHTYAEYHKIPDGNAKDNGTPGFNCSDQSWPQDFPNSTINEIWNLAITVSNKYNGVDDRYLNKSIAEGGLDFSDFSEVHYILELEEMNDCTDYIQWLIRQLE